MAKFLNAQVKDGKIIQADILLSDEEIKEYPFVNAERNASFYSYIMKLIENANELLSGKPVSDKPTFPGKMDCTKINTAKNIQASWYEYAKEHGINQTSLTMTIAMAGPKSLEEIPCNQIQILSECLKYETNEP